MIEKLMDAMKQTVLLLDRESEKEVVLFHHNDTDGLSSGSILLSAFELCGYDVSRYSLEKPYPSVLNKVFGNKGRIIVFTDFAGKIAPDISLLNNQKNLVLILDHHPAEPVDDSTVINLDGDLFGLKGDRDISASATAFLFASLLLESKGLDSDRFAHLGVLGAIGDGFYVNGALSGVNRELLHKAVACGSMRIKETGEGEEYFIKLGGKEYTAASVCALLDTLGGVAYYKDGTDRGIQVCLNGIDEETSRYGQSLEALQNEIFEREKAELAGNLHESKNIQWFDVKNRFEPMGVKMIGVFCNTIRDSSLVNHKKYLAGFQRVPRQVPGFGSLDRETTKISMRVSSFLTERIRRKEIPGLNDFLPEATKRLGGFADACHSLSAATTVSVGQEEALIREAEKVLKQEKQK